MNTCLPLFMALFNNRPMISNIKIVTWNCAMGLRRKLQHVERLDADILILQECSKTDSEQLRSIGMCPGNWIGRNPHKGLTLACKSGISITSESIQGIEWAIRGTAVCGTLTLGIIAIWACAPNRHERYVRQIHKLLDQGELMRMSQNSIMLGDFNSNTIWDGKHRDRSHSHAVQRLMVEGYRSAYHDLSGDEQGKESTPTFFMHRHVTKPYHIDYAFLSEQLHRRLLKVEIGMPSEWITVSDHMPFTITLCMDNCSEC